MMRLRPGVFIAVVFALVAPGSAWARDVEVVVRLDSPGVAEANVQSRVLSSAAKRQRLDLRSPTSRSYLDAVALSQRRFEAKLAHEVPGSRYPTLARVRPLSALIMTVTQVRKGRQLSLIPVSSASDSSWSIPYASWTAARERVS